MLRRLLRSLLCGLTCARDTFYCFRALNCLTCFMHGLSVRGDSHNSFKHHP